MDYFEVMTVAPKDASDDCIARARALLAHAGAAGIQSGVREDLGRLALVMAVAAIDTYMHMVVLQRVSTMRSAIPKPLQELDIEFARLTSLADVIVEAQRSSHSIRPWVAVKHALQERLLQETFQSYDSVGKAMAMAGVKKAWTSIAPHLGCTAEDIKTRLNAIVHRRNQIVHEGDMRRMARPRAIVHSTIDLAAVQSDIDWLDQLLAGIARVVP